MPARQGNQDHIRAGNAPKMKRCGMRFRVGPWTYGVEITDNELQNDEGQPAWGVCDWSNRTIRISNKLPVRQRLDLLLHELREAWWEHLGRPGDREADCNQVASFTADAMRQLLAQGGEPSLMRLNVDGVVESSGARELMSTHLPKCKCGSMFSPGDVKNSKPYFHPEAGVLVISRSVACDFCQKDLVWVEACTQAGLPNGRVVEMEPAI